MVYSVADRGMDGSIIMVEAHGTRGLPGTMVVGMGNRAIDEAKERLRNAFHSSGLSLPPKRYTLNLAPADLPKDGSTFDVAMALSLLVAAEQCPTEGLDECIFIGELGLDGSIRAVRGIIGKLLYARQNGYKKAFIPHENLAQARLVEGIDLIPLTTLQDAYLHLTNQRHIPVINTKNYQPDSVPTKPDVDFADVIGQFQAKRALEIAAAGGHNILLDGPPGAGKSMMAKASSGILPAMSREEILEITQLHSLAGHNFSALMTERPFRAPHYTASDVSIVGGGQNSRPGEISLAHRGVLFLDEFPEFSRRALESLRQPLEDRSITIARAKDTTTYPANFILIATRNPCPCGYYGSSKPCSCLPNQMLNYNKKLSGPIMDRIDLHVTVEEIDHSLLLNNGKRSESSVAIRTRVEKARAIQASRFKNAGTTNATMNNKQISQLARLDSSAKQLLDKASEQLRLSARSYMRCIKVARTIADLEGSEIIAQSHVGEALQYRARPNESL